MPELYAVFGDFIAIADTFTVFAFVLP